jgi:tetratricopeptide (TPR) repeat protein
MPKLVFSMGATVALLLAVERGHAQSEHSTAAQQTLGTDPRQIAHEEYSQGKAAFEAGDYLRAAQLFLEAYRHAPHHDALWNAARSFELAGDKARAANVYSRYLAIAPADARDRDRATAARKELAGSLGRLDIHGNATDIRVDDIPVEGTSTYVEPGQHLIRGREGNAVIGRVESVQAGAVVSVVLEGVAAMPPPAPPPERAAPPPQIVASEQGGRKPLSPIFFYTGLALTAVAGGLTIGSGIDTLETSRSMVEEGQYKESRTNVFFWTTAGLAVVTTAVALFLVDWGRSRPAAHSGPSPGSTRLGGSF